MSFRKFPRSIIIALLTTTLILTACNGVAGANTTPTVDINAMNTAIVGTTVAQIADQGV